MNIIQIIGDDRTVISALVALNLTIVGSHRLQEQSNNEWITREVRAPMVSFHTFESKAAKSKVSFHLIKPAEYDTEP
ncbi:MAG: hypothetical protein NTU72_08295, partial [Fimbriimonadales bacterium]|nr:hypothetical protein [Fimbriimonadales bacterium]